MKRVFAVCMLCLAVVALMGVTALAQDGTYAATAKGFGGDVTVTLTIAEGKIADALIEGASETEGIGSLAIEKMAGEIVALNDVEVDAFASATFTSNAILEAAAAALAQSGLTNDDLVHVEKEEVAGGETIELTTEVVVIGGGGAGLSAAVTVCEQGGSVIVIDKAPAVGGNTARAGGTLNAADLPRQQNFPMVFSEEEVLSYINAEPENAEHQLLMNVVRKQYEAYKQRGDTYLFDSPELHALQTYEGGDRVGELDLIEVMTANAANARTWLEGYGCVWGDNVFLTIGGLWQRSLNPSGGAKKNLVDTMVTALEGFDKAQILVNTKAVELIQENGRVTGVRAENSEDGNTYVIRGTKAVILATGGYAANAEMVKELHNVDVSITSCATTSTGDGLKLATDVGAALTGMDYIQIHPLGDPKTGALQKAYGGVTDPIFVNKEGKRFVNEQGRRDEIANAILEQTDDICYAFYDNATGESLDARVASGDAFVADTIEEVAALVGVDGAQLKETVEAYNAMMAAGEDTEYHKSVAGRQLITAPYALVPLAPTVHHTMGGVKIDTSARVLDESGEPISGLLAAGEVTGGIHGSNRIGGNAIADIFVFGRIAGNTAMKSK